MTGPDRSTRRDFLRSASAGAAVTLAATTAPAVVRSAEPSGAKLPQLAVASYTFRKFDLDQTLAMTKRLAVSAICLKSFHLPLDADAEQIAAAVAKTREASILLYGGGVITMKTADAVNQAFEYAKAAGMKKIIGVPGLDPNMLPLVNDKVQQYDIEVCIHNHGPGDKDYPTPDVAYERIKNLDRRIGLCHDVGHTIRAGQDPIAMTLQCADRILDVHFKDVTEATAKGTAIPCGRGVIDIPGLLRAIVKTGYQGYLSFEYEADENDPLPGLAESVGYVRGVLDCL